MPRFLVVLVLVGLVPATASCQEPPIAEPGSEERVATASDNGFASEKEKASYAVGFSFGNAAQFRKVDLAAEQVIAGVRDGLAGEGGRLSEQEVQVLTRMVQNTARKRFQEEAEVRREEGKAFLTTNKERAGVVATESGLQYEVVREGDGPKPAPSDTVTLHYRGFVLDGTEFDSSYDRGEPTRIQADGFIPAWNEALPMMSVGSVWKLYTAPELGLEGMGLGSPNRKAPIGSTLIYEIELLSIEPPAASEEASEE